LLDQIPLKLPRGWLFWPGNIRELQSVIEHSAILCDDDIPRVTPVLVVEKQPGVRSTSRLDTKLHHIEQELIEQALEETAGRVSGPSGAAARLGVPSSTLESKIRRFKIDKLRYHLDLCVRLMRVRRLLADGVDIRTIQLMLGRRHHLRQIVQEWAHYNRGRPHASLGPGIPEPLLESPEQSHRPSFAVRPSGFV
jgi:hypothetical protein